MTFLEHIFVSWFCQDGVDFKHRWTAIWPFCPRFRMSLCSSGASRWMFPAGDASVRTHASSTRQTHNISILNPENQSGPAEKRCSRQVWPLTVREREASHYQLDFSPGTGRVNALSGLFTVRESHLFYLIHFSLWLVSQHQWLIHDPITSRTQTSGQRSAVIHHWHTE